METRQPRLFYIDNLRLLVISLVVMHHLAIIVSGFGGFYYTHPQAMGTLSTIWFAFYLSFQQGYFMGLLFLIGGYFVPASYAHRGFASFIGERFRRLMIPSLITMMLISPFIEIVELGKVPKVFNLYDFLSGTGVLWFAVALFLFSLFYALLQRLPRNSASVSEPKPYTPRIIHAFALMGIIAVFAFLLRIAWPIGTNVLNMQLGFFSQYIILFIVGTRAARFHLFEKITYQAAKRWLIAGIVPGFVLWLLAVGLASRLPGGTNALMGGFTWESAVYALWESFTAVAVDIGLIGVFREKLNYQGKLVKALSDSSFTVYMFHPVFITEIGVLFSAVNLAAFPKWIGMVLISLPLVYAAAYYVFRRIPLLKSIL